MKILSFGLVLAPIMFAQVASNAAKAAEPSSPSAQTQVEEVDGSRRWKREHPGVADVVMADGPPDNAQELGSECDATYAPGNAQNDDGARRTLTESIGRQELECLERR